MTRTADTCGLSLVGFVVVSCRCSATVEHDDVAVQMDEKVDW